MKRWLQEKAPTLPLLCSENIEEFVWRYSPLPSVE